MKILVIGLAKSGTTAIYYKIKDALKGSVGFFEPQRFHGRYGKKDVVAKILFDNYYEKNFSDFLDFDKKVIIVRDPRDTIVSNFIFFLHLDFWYGSRRFKKALELLKMKEADPDSISLIGLIRKTRELGGFNINLEKMEKSMLFSLKFQEKRKDFFVLKYEDMVDGKLKDLEDYLGFKISEGEGMEKEASYIIRSKKYGGWKNWFTKEDVKFFKPKFEEYLKKYGYDLSWELNLEKKINSRECSEYFIKSSKDRLTGKNRIMHNIKVLAKKPLTVLKSKSKFFTELTNDLRGFTHDPLKNEVALEVEKEMKRAKAEQ